MNKLLSKIIVSITFLSFVIPLIFHLYYLPILNLGSAILLFFIDGICILLWFSSLCIYCFFHENKTNIYRFLSVNILVVIIYIVLFFTGSINNIANYLFFKLREDQLNEIVTTIRSNNKIISIDTRIGRYENETLNLSDTEKLIYNDIVNRLKELRIIRLTVKDSMQIFLTGGFQDGFGFIYNHLKNEPIRNKEAYFREFKKLEENWYSFKE